MNRAQVSTRPNNPRYSEATWRSGNRASSSICTQQPLERQSGVQRVTELSGGSLFNSGLSENSHDAASLESSQCWSCRCCSLTFSSGASGRTSAGGGQQMPERVRTRQNSPSFNPHPIRAAAKVTVCLSTTFRLIHNLHKKRNSHQSYSSLGENLLWPFYPDSDSIVIKVRIKKGKRDLKTVVQTTVK